MIKTLTEIRTRYPDCDKMGVVHHAVYPLWYEQARMDWLEAAGLHYSRLSALSVNPAMVALHIQYKGAAGYPQTLYITTLLKSYAPKKLELEYELRDEAGSILSTAVTFHIWTGPDNKSYNMEQQLPDMYEKIKSAGE